jgi:hypothetical protein
LETLRVKLERVQKAIMKLEEGGVSSYEIEGRKITYNNISTLYQREKELLKLIDRYGADYILGSNSRPQRRVALVSFK